MQIETSLPADNLHAVPELARRAEALGFDGLAAAEVSSNPFITLGIAAEHTERARLITSVALAFVRSPVTMAHGAMDLQRFSGGRFWLGLGTQQRWQIERRFGMPWSAPVPRLRDYIKAMRAVWAGWQDPSPFRYEGEIYQLDVMSAYHRPGNSAGVPFPKIVLSGIGPMMSRLTGEIADGVRMHPFSSPKYATEVFIPNLRRGAERVGRSLADFQISGGGMIGTAPTEEGLKAVMDRLRFAISNYGYFPEYRQVWEVEGLDDLGETVRAYGAAQRWSEMPALISDEVVHQFAAVGTYAEIGERIVERFGSFATSVTLPMPEPGYEEDLRRSIRVIQDARAPTL